MALTYARGPAREATSNRESAGSAAESLRTLIAKDGRDGTVFIDKMLKSAESFNDYSFKYKMTVYHGAKTVTEGGNFWFKKPRLMRLKVTAGSRAGSVAVLEKNGKVKARMGGVLKLFIVNLPLNSNLLKSPNGYPFADSDYVSLAKETKKFLAAGCTSLVSENPLSVDSQSRKVYVLEISKNGVAAEPYKRAYIDSHLIVPVEWFDYEDGRLLAHTVWHDFKPNQGLSDELFTIRGGK